GPAGFDGDPIMHAGAETEDSVAKVRVERHGALGIGQLGIRRLVQRIAQLRELFGIRPLVFETELRLTARRLDTQVHAFAPPLPKIGEAVADALPSSEVERLGRNPAR